MEGKTISEVISGIVRFSGKSLILRMTDNTMYILESYVPSHSDLGGLEIREIKEIPKSFKKI